MPPVLHSLNSLCVLAKFCVVHVHVAGPIISAINTAGSPTRLSRRTSCPSSLSWVALWWHTATLWRMGRSGGSGAQGPPGVPWEARGKDASARAFSPLLCPRPLWCCHHAVPPWMQSLLACQRPPAFPAVALDGPLSHRTAKRPRVLPVLVSWVPGLTVDGLCVSQGGPAVQGQALASSGWPVCAVMAPLLCGGAVDWDQQAWAGAITVP